MPSYVWAHAALAAANAQLGRDRAVRQAAREFLSVAPELGSELSADAIEMKTRRELGKWSFSGESLPVLEHLIEGLRKAVTLAPL